MQLHIVLTQNIAISRPILYGNTATPLTEEEKANPDVSPDHTHSWTIFVRSPVLDMKADAASISRVKNKLAVATNKKEASPAPENNHELGFIKKVVFKLHDTYANSTRTIEEPPFEVTETGWGEFEISIRIFFPTEMGEKNILLYHHLKLHPYKKDNIPAQIGAPGGAPNANEDDENANVPQPVDSYVYDELVFNEPSEQMFELLTSRPGALLPAKTDPNDPSKSYSLQTEAEELDRLTAGLETVYQQVQKTKEYILQLEKEKEALSQ